MAVMVGVPAHLFVVGVAVATVIIYQWLSDRIRSRSADPITVETTTTTTTTAAAAVATPAAAEQIQIREEDHAFIEREVAAALESTAAANGGGGWISEIDPRVRARIQRIAGRIGWAVVDSVVEGYLLRRSKVGREVYYALRSELRRS